MWLRQGGGYAVDAGWGEVDMMAGQVGPRVPGNWDCCIASEWKVGAKSMLSSSRNSFSEKDIMYIKK